MRRRVNLPVSAIVAAYNGGEGPTSIARRYGVSDQTIRNRLTDAGVPLTQRTLVDLPIDEIATEYAAGVPAPVLAWWHGVDPATIERRLKQHGVKLRTPAEEEQLRRKARKARKGGTSMPGQAARAVAELRTLLREWAEYTDTALVSLTQDLLRHYGFWGDDDHDAACARRARFTEGTDEDLRAYDGWSNEPAKRALTGRERDILCRILRDVKNYFTPYDPEDGTFALVDGEARVAVDRAEMELLANIRFVLDPRHD